MVKQITLTLDTEFSCEYYENDILPCGIISTGAQCMCDVCYDAVYSGDDY